MSIGRVVTQARLAAERLMVSSCTISRPTGSTEGPGGVISPTYTTIYTGKARLKPGALRGDAVEIGEAARVVERLVLWIPASAPDLAEADKVTITASPINPNLVGKVFTVRAVARSSTPTRIEAELIEVTS